MPDKGGEEAQLPYRQQVIRALVQRYIESARREFEETKRKDIGNRITELSKSVSRMHSDMKVIQQLLVDDEHFGSGALKKDGSSILGKYIIGAKNNFRGFHSSHEDKNTPLKVTVHQQEEEGDEVKVDLDTKEETDAHQTQAGTCEAEETKKETDCDVVKMEEGRAKAETGEEKETEKKEQVEVEGNEELKEEGGAGASVSNVDEKVKGEASQEEEKGVIGGTTAGEDHTEKTAEPTENVKLNNEKTKFRDIELQEKKVAPKWVKGRKYEQDVGKTRGDGETKDKTGTKKIPSPTGSSSSQDTGFGSQEGEGSIDGTRVRP